jgi:phospholipid transport system substrate-binding protein
MGGGASMPVTWRLVKRGGGYRIFDVNVDGIWLASTQKTNFVSVLKKNNGEMSALLDYLRK